MALESALPGSPNLVGSSLASRSRWELQVPLKDIWHCFCFVFFPQLRVYVISFAGSKYVMTGGFEMCSFRQSSFSVVVGWSPVACSVVVKEFSQWSFVTEVFSELVEVVYRAQKSSGSSPFWGAGMFPIAVTLSSSSLRPPSVTLWPTKETVFALNVHLLTFSFGLTSQVLLWTTEIGIMFFSCGTPHKNVIDGHVPMHG